MASVKGLMRMSSMKGNKSDEAEVRSEYKKSQLW